MACGSNCRCGPCASQPLGMDKYHQGGVTQLQYVGDVETSNTSGAVVEALKFGLMAMGISCLLGIKPPMSRWIGIAGVGLGLAKKGWE